VLSAHDLPEIDDRYRRLAPAEEPAGGDTAFAGDEPAVRRDDGRMKESDLSDAARQSLEVAHVLAEPLADDDRIDRAHGGALIHGAPPRCCPRRSSSASMHSRSASSRACISSIAGNPRSARIRSS
jgi:hypothetical protein